MNKLKKIEGLKFARLAPGCWAKPTLPRREQVELSRSATQQGGGSDFLSFVKARFESRCPHKLATSTPSLLPSSSAGTARPVPSSWPVAHGTAMTLEMLPTTPSKNETSRMAAAQDSHAVATSAIHASSAHSRRHTRRLSMCMCGRRRSRRRYPMTATTAPWEVILTYEAVQSWNGVSCCHRGISMWSSATPSQENETPTHSTRASRRQEPFTWLADVAGGASCESETSSQHARCVLGLVQSNLTRT